LTTPTIAVITGPTATGKTRLGVLLAQDLGGEVVSADSMQLYRGMDIGTAKPTVEETRGVPHHMIDVADPEESWSAARYAEAAGRCVDDILRRGKLPIVVGGTGLYIDALLAGREFADAPGDTGLREALAEEYDRRGGEAMLEALRAVDPERAGKLHPADKKRVLRALEVYRLTGRTITEHDAASRLQPPRYRAAKLALDFQDRTLLYARIDRRVDEMVRRGLMGEVRGLLDRGLPPGCTAMQAIGYKEAALALRGELTEAEAIDRIKRESRRYAKRQLTWLRRDERVHWFRWENEPDFAAARRDSTDFFLASGIE
jgi:tRNA dimethylallyltransferase